MIAQRAAILAWLAWDSAGFFEWLAARPWYTQILIDWVAAIPIEPGEQGLEVGCGPGLLTGLVAARGVQMSGLDRSPAMVERARRSIPDCTFIEGDALDLPLEDHSVDVAFAASVVNLVSDPRTLTTEMARVVRSGGRVSVLFPTPTLSDDAARIAQQLGLEGLSAAALQTWASKAPKREPSMISPLFDQAGLLDIRVDRFFDGTVASVTGTVP